MRALIYTGGVIAPERITEHPKSGDLVIAADSGYENAKTLGVTPAVLLGDFDSLGEEKLKKIPDGIEILRVPAEKDRTDTQLAVDVALARGAGEIVVIGGLCGRLDHSLSNLAVLERLHALAVPAVINDGFNRARFVRNGGALIGRSAFTYLSLIAVDPVVKGVTIKGCKYPLENAKIIRDCQFAVSNEMTGNCALIEVRRGGLYIIESS